MIPDEFIIFVIFLTYMRIGVFGMTIHEVNVGETAKLPCPSNDHEHRFQYWQLMNDDMIGPWNNWKGHKIKYEVTTGELTIKEVSMKESGFYKCVSKALAGPALHVETVKLVVKHDWEETYEDDTTVNTYRALIAFFCFLILMLFGILVFIIAKRRKLRYLEEEREDSPDLKLPPPRRTYEPTTVPYFPTSGRKKKGESNAALIGDTVETDMRTSFPLPDFG